MNTMTKRLYAPNLIVICVDGIHGSDYEGRLWDQYHEEAVHFDSMLEVLQHVDHFLDELDFPQRSTALRTFQDQTTTMKVRQRVERKMVMSNLEDKNGKEGTFIVQVKYRQNATWQGQVVWAEQNKKVYFRSALELLRLMDNALNSKDAFDHAGDDSTFLPPSGSTAGENKA